MNSVKGFFQSGDASTPYVNLRDQPHLREARDFVEAIWPEFQPFADRHFLVDAQNHFLQRFWEMYLGVTLIRKGFSLNGAGDEGPDFYFRLGNRKVWIEAIAPDGGTGPDAVPQLPIGQETSVPQERILLRYTRALQGKLKRLNEALKKGIVNVNDHYVVAVNCRAIPDAPFGSVIPYALMAYLPIGNPVALIDKRSRQIVEPYFQYRDQVVKNSGARIPTNPFLNSDYSGISGVLHSATYPVDRPAKMGGDFWFLHNPLASQPLDKTVFFVLHAIFFRGRNPENYE